MTTRYATLQVDTLTTEDRSVLERVLDCSLDGLKSIEVQHLAGAVKYRLGAGVKQSVGV